jgi:hypothetical protein
MAFARTGNLRAENWIFSGSSTGATAAKLQQSFEGWLKQLYHVVDVLI